MVCLYFHVSFVFKIYDFRVTYVFMIKLHCAAALFQSEWRHNQGRSLSFESFVPLVNHYIENHLLTCFHPFLAEHAMPCLSKQCRSRSVGF